MFFPLLLILLFFNFRRGEWFVINNIVVVVVDNGDIDDVESGRRDVDVDDVASK